MAEGSGVSSSAKRAESGARRRSAKFVVERFLERGVEDCGVVVSALRFRDREHGLHTHHLAADQRSETCRIESFARS